MNLHIVTYFQFVHQARFFYVRLPPRFDFSRCLVKTEDTVRSWVGNANFNRLGQTRGKLFSKARCVDFPSDTFDDSHPGYASIQKLLASNTADDFAVDSLHHKDATQFESQIFDLVELLSRNNFVNLLGQTVLVAFWNEVMP